MTTPYCVLGCTRGTGLQIARQLAERGAPVLGVARDPVKARGLLPAASEIHWGDVTDPSSLSAARLGACCTIFFAVDITGGVGGRGFFKPAGVGGGENPRIFGGACRPGQSAHHRCAPDAAMHPDLARQFCWGDRPL